MNRMITGVLVLLAAAATACGSSGGGRPSPPPTPTPGTSTPAPHRASCAATLPASWTAAVDAGLVPARAAGATPVRALAVDTAGAVLVLAGRTPHETLVVIGRDRSIRPLFTVPARVGRERPVRVGTAALDRRWAVAALIAGGGQGRLAAIVVIDRGTGHARTIRDLGGGFTANAEGPVLARGAVYWLATGTGGRGRGHVYRFTPATGARTIVGSGRVLGLQSVAGGVFWTDADVRRIVWRQRPDLPRGAEPVPGKVYSGISDGTRYALGWWLGPPREPRWTIRLWSRPAAAPATVYRGTGDEMAFPQALAGPYLIWVDSDRGGVVMDTRTGATASLSRLGVSGALSGTGVIAFNLERDGGRVSVVPATQLTGLRC